jgi:hypothetical protein
MHGAFIVCLKEMVISKFDENFWIEALEQAGIDKHFHPVSNKEVADEMALKLIKSTIKRLNMDDRRFGEIFGNYWINQYARKNYFAFFDAHKRVKDFLNNLNKMHQRITAKLSKPTTLSFTITWESSSCAIIDYHSNRGLVHLAVGLLKALGDYYHEDIAVYRIGADRLKLFINEISSNN